MASNPLDINRMLQICNTRDVDRKQCKNEISYLGCLSEYLMRECGWIYTCRVFVTHSYIQNVNAIANKIVYNFQFEIVMRISGFQQSKKKNKKWFYEYELKQT